MQFQQPLMLPSYQLNNIILCRRLLIFSCTTNFHITYKSCFLQHAWILMYVFNKGLWGSQKRTPWHNAGLRLPITNATLHHHPLSIAKPFVFSICFLALNPMCSILLDQSPIKDLVEGFSWWLHHVHSLH